MIFWERTQSKECSAASQVWAQSAHTHTDTEVLHHQGPCSCSQGGDCGAELAVCVVCLQLQVVFALYQLLDRSLEPELGCTERGSL